MTKLIKISEEEQKKLKSCIPNFKVIENLGNTFSLVEVDEKFISTLELNNITYEEFSRINS